MPASEPAQSTSNTLICTRSGSLAALATYTDRFNQS